LKPEILDNDGYSAFGYPWEFKYVNNYWIKSKAGSLDGYRSQVAIVPPIDLGIFCSATVDADDSTLSILTIPSLEILIPAFTQALWDNQPTIPLPPDAETFTGLYQFDDPEDGHYNFEVYINHTKQEMMAFVDDIGLMNLTQFDATTFKVQLLVEEECRWLNDGANEEFIYFSFGKSQDSPTSLMFMETVFQFISKNCRNCNTKHQ